MNDLTARIRVRRPSTGETWTESMETFSGGTRSSRARSAMRWFREFALSDDELAALDKWTVNGRDFYDITVEGR